MQNWNMINYLMNLTWRCQQVCFLPLNKDNNFWEKLITTFFWYDTDRIEDDDSNNSFGVYSLPR
jgi:hypothetical protein